MDTLLRRHNANVLCEILVKNAGNMSQRETSTCSGNVASQTG
jgi:hypothetical protein